jgi:hypothetical protein
MIASQQLPGHLLQPQKSMAQQPSEQETRQKIPLGAASGGNFTNYTNPQYGFSLLYPSEWINEEINPGANMTLLISFGPPPSEFGDFIFVYVAVKNLTNNNTSLEQFANQEISLLKSPPAMTSPTDDTGAATILESGPTTIAGGNTPAHRVVYTQKVSGTLSKIMEIYAVQGDKGYILTYMAYSVTLKPGSYSVTENSLLEYTLSKSSECAGSLSAGQTKQCTISNIYQPIDKSAQLIVINSVIDNNNDYSSSELTVKPSAFIITVHGNDPLPRSFPGKSEEGVIVNLNPGRYSVTADGPDGIRLLRWL